MAARYRRDRPSTPKEQPEWQPKSARPRATRRPPVEQSDYEPTANTGEQYDDRRDDQTPDDLDYLLSEQRRINDAIKQAKANLPQPTALDKVIAKQSTSYEAWVPRMLANRVAARIAAGQATVELWAMDEHRIGLKPLIRRVWAPIGQRPSAVVEHRFRWRSLVGFVHPASGRTVWHLASGVSIPLFEAELAAFARTVGASPRKQIVLVLDQAGWHTSERLRVPEHVHLLFLPPYAPALQPAEQLWPLTNEALVNAHVAGFDALEDAQLAHCAALQQRRTLIRSTTLFHWWPKHIKRRQGPRRN